MRPQLDRRTCDVFREALTLLVEAELPVVIGGAFALNHYTGIWRYTKDLDLFCPRSVGERAVGLLAAHGFRTHIEEKHWLGKATKADTLVDFIWGSGNWATFVDDGWFARAQAGDLCGARTLVAAPEDLILSKAYVAGRERFDGTDIAHLMFACGATIDWPQLAARFGDHWMLLLHYVLLYRFVYPQERERVPTGVIRALAARVGTDAELGDGLDFRGPLLDRYGYLHDLLADGRRDPREQLASRAGLPLEDVRLRRHLDSEAFEAGLPYRHDCEAKGEPPHWHDGLPRED